MTTWVILDRDGVINADSDHFIRNLDEWRPLPGSIDAIARLCRAGFRVAVATNQSGVGRGLIAPEAGSPVSFFALTFQRMAATAASPDPVFCAASRRGLPSI